MKNFIYAQEHMALGRPVTRGSWPAYVYIRMYESETILIHGKTGWGVWKPKVDDLLAQDWHDWVPLSEKQKTLELQPDPVPMPAVLLDMVNES